MSMATTPTHPAHSPNVSIVRKDFSPQTTWSCCRPVPRSWSALASVRSAVAPARRVAPAVRPAPARPLNTIRKHCTISTAFQQEHKSERDLNVISETKYTDRSLPIFSAVMDLICSERASRVAMRALFSLHTLTTRQVEIFRSRRLRGWDDETRSSGKCDPQQIRYLSVPVETINPQILSVHQRALLIIQLKLQSIQFLQNKKKTRSPGGEDTRRVTVEMCAPRM